MATKNFIINRDFAHDKPKEECGIFGIYNHPEASHLAYLGLYALQHRGQESCGIVSSDRKRTFRHISMGKVVDSFTPEILSSLEGDVAIGHVRYSTTGSSNIHNAQPIRVASSKGEIAIAHNGNIVNAFETKNRLVSEGSIFQTGSDSEVVLHLIARSQKANFEDALVEAFSNLNGAFSVILLTKDKLYALRDPNGFRPLVLGKIHDSFVVASETSAFDVIDAEYLREVEPGEVLIIDQNGLNSLFPFKKGKQANCIFELI